MGIEDWVFGFVTTVNVVAASTLFMLAFLHIGLPLVAAWLQQSTRAPLKAHDMPLLNQESLQRIESNSSAMTQASNDQPSTPRRSTSTNSLLALRDALRSGSSISSNDSSHWCAKDSAALF